MSWLKQEVLRYEKAVILNKLEEVNWSRVRAAAKLGISRVTLHRKMKDLQIQEPKRSTEENQ